MTIKGMHSIIFSPTGTTRTVMESVCRGMGPMCPKETDLTQPQSKIAPCFFTADDVVILGMPVYSGRLPSLAVDRFRGMKGYGTPIVALVVYGNRAYEDALLELCDLCEKQGFKVVGAGAFIGQHSFSSDEYPIGHHRPDQKDIDQAERFGREIKQRIHNDSVVEIAAIPGSRPYKPEMQPAGAATKTELSECTLCGKCVESCPSQCIRLIEGQPQTESAKCIWCMACIRACPTGARKVGLPKIHEMTQRLHTTCQTRQEPEWFCT